MRVLPSKKAPIFIPNAITALGLLFGLLVIFKMNMIEPGTSNYAMIYGAAMLLLVSAVADFADGLVARWLRSQTQFGLIFDSLNDAITFGVAPAVVVLKTLSPEAKTLFSFWATAAAMAYCLCGVLRLVRYSTQNQFQSSHAPMGGRTFTGLPIPVACMALVSLTLFLSSEFAGELWEEVEAIRAYTLILAQFFLGFLMISRWRFPARLMIGSHASYASACAMALAMAGILYLSSHNFSLALVAVVWVYILGAWMRNLFFWLTGSRDRAIAPRYDWKSLESDKEKEIASELKNLK